MPTMYLELTMNIHSNDGGMRRFFLRFINWHRPFYCRRCAKSIPQHDCEIISILNNREFSVLFIPLTTQYLGIAGFCIYNALIMLYFYSDHEVVCYNVSLFHDDAVFWWACSSIVHIIAFIIYMMSWRLINIFNTYTLETKSLEMEKLGSIFRSIVLVTIADLSGWTITQIIVVVLNMLVLC
uniref:G protein-coupled receptor n=1 Tax=Pristionchus pacificus TaxID=54126 RepID=A0A8R1YX67_PRIPA